MKKILLLAFIGTASSSISAQSLEFTIKGVSDTTVYLANYYGEKLYYADTSRSDKNGTAIFNAKDLEQGKYAVVIPGPKYFEVLIADGEAIKMQTDTNNLVENMQVLESENNKLMYDYISYINDKRIEREKYAEELKANEGNAKKTAAIKVKYNELNNQVVNYQTALIQDHANKFVAKEIKMSMDVEPPKELQDDKVKAYQYYKNHYFDNIDLHDERIIRTAVFHGKLNRYFTETLLQNPDTLIKATDDLMAKIEPGSEVYKYVAHYATYLFESSKLMGMDKGFVHMVDNYLKDDLAFWLDEEQLKDIRERADAIRHTLIGLEAPELILADSAGNWKSSFKDINKKYTLLYFYDPDCGHCKKETPKLVEFYSAYDKGNLGIYAVSAEHNDKWHTFVNKYNMKDFVNVSIPQKAYDSAEYATSLITSGKTTYQSLKYQDTFDVYSTPKLFLIDENHIIQAKDFGVGNLEDILKMLEQREAFYKEKEQEKSVE